jgi:hypothetical protein
MVRLLTCATGFDFHDVGDHSFDMAVQVQLEKRKLFPIDS